MMPVAPVMPTTIRFGTPMAFLLPKRDLCRGFQRRRGLARLRELTKAVQQDRPLGIALAEVASGVRPTAMSELDQRASLVGARDLERRFGADGVAGTLHASPYDFICRRRRPNRPSEGRPSVRELEPPPPIGGKDPPAVP